jgi:hypothetical protein
MNQWVSLTKVKEHFKHALDLNGPESEAFLEALSVNFIHTKTGVFVDWIALTWALSWMGRLGGEHWVLPGATLTMGDMNKLRKKVTHLDKEEFQKDLRAVMGEHLLRLTHATQVPQSTPSEEYTKALLRWQAKFDEIRPRAAVQAVAHKAARDILASGELP